MIAPTRLPLELGGGLVIQPSQGPAFTSSEVYECVLSRKGQFSPILPQKGFKKTGVKVLAPARMLNAGAISCAVPRVVTAGNTTVCIHTQRNQSCAVKEWPPPSQWPLAFLEHFALFAPAFSRRPYVREIEGKLQVAIWPKHRKYAIRRRLRDGHPRQIHRFRNTNSNNPMFL